MNFVDEIVIALNEFFACDVVFFVRVVCSEIDDYEIRWGMSEEVPVFGIITPDLVGAAGGIRRLEPLIFLESRD